MPRVGVEATISVLGWAETFLARDPAATVMGLDASRWINILWFKILLRMLLLPLCFYLII
jgi:hypothetical protein